MKTMDGYPTSWGSSKASVFPHVGPLSYTQLGQAVGTVPVTNGDLIEAIEAGLKHFDVVFPGMTDDGIFMVIPIQITSSGTATQRGVPTTTWRALWFSLFTGAAGGQAQVAGTQAAALTNLSTFTVRLTAIGPK